MPWHSEFCKAIHHQDRYLDGAAGLAPLEDHHLEAAFLEFRRVITISDDLARLGVDLGSEDPFRDCPVCAATSRDVLTDGKLVPRFSCSLACPYNALAPSLLRTHA